MSTVRRRLLRRLRPPSSAPIVVTGAPRSGTTYLRAILEHHPEVRLSNELRVFRWAHEVLHSSDDEQLVLRGPHRDAVLGAAEARLPGLIRDVYGDLYPGIPRWGDKNPFYAEDAAYLETIVRLFPQARIVNLVRDGRDVATSLSRRRTPEGRPWASLDRGADLWIRCVDAVESFADVAPQGVLLDIAYEDLTADDLAMADRVLDFLGLGMTSEVRDFCLEQGRRRTPISQPTTDLEEAGDEHRSTGWRALAPDDRLMLLDRLGPTLVRRGYETLDSLDRCRREAVPR